MGVRDLVGQMFVVGVGGTEPDYYIEKMIRERNIGGVLLFGHNMESEAQTRALTGKLQELSDEDGAGRSRSSSPWTTRGAWSRGRRGSPRSRPASRVGARGDPARAREIAEQIGRELRRAGVNTDLAPVVDTGFGAAIGNRSYGDDPRLVARDGRRGRRGLRERRAWSRRPSTSRTTAPRPPTRTRPCPW